ncbi:MAG TPA: BamA/TamA family outer membrane protein [Longimicrobium sp.]|nr:BamA/TamA family outer membrane protein [Longimicrobium sp.]
MRAPTPFRRLALAAALVAGAAAPRALAAQGDDAPGPCPDGVVSQIFVDNNSVFVVGDPELDARFNWAYRLANQLHVRTREGVIRRELLFREGSCYRPELLEDSERILRAAPFIADADVFAVPQGDGSHHVIVETRDEWSTRLEPQFQSGGEVALTGVELREDNLFGRGQRVSAWSKESQGERIYGVGVATTQLLRSHLDAEAAIGKTPVGFSYQERVTYPFRGEGGRWAARQSFEHEARNFEFFLPQPGGLDRRFFPVERTAFDFGVVHRLGRRGRLTLFGVGMAGEWVLYPQDTLAADDDGPEGAIPAPPQFVPGLDTLESVRVMFLAGQRNVFFDRRRALDAVRGVEDVRLGFEAELGIGRSLNTFSTDDDLAARVGLSAAGDLPGGVLGGMRLEVEAQRDYGADTDGREWRNVFGQLDAWGYWRPGPESGHTWVAALRGSGGWYPSVPFQLTLGNRSGLRGYTGHTHAGERRVVGTLEHRAYLGWPYPRLFDLGTALFVDAGATWAGGDSFGENSGVRVGAGGGLRLAFPPGSRQTYRIDVAFPAAPDFRPGKLQVTIGVGQAVGRGAVREDPQVRRSASRTLSTSLFNYPN